MKFHIFCYPFVFSFLVFSVAINSTHKRFALRPTLFSFIKQQASHPAWLAATVSFAFED
jgi:hypothetical protein